MSKSKKKSNKGIWGIIGLAVACIIAAITGAVININVENGKVEATITYSEEEQPAYITDDKGEVEETTEYNGEKIPTVEEVDGGMFEDESTGLSVTEGDYSDLGWSEWYPTSTPEEFVDATLGRCIIAGNKFGAQCVSYARVYWWSYANRDVSTCGTGMAKGMMNCAEQNAGNDFLVFWGSNGIQAGDWLVSDGGQYGHVCMALGPVTNGYVACAGENQGGHKCEGYAGAAVNIINFSVKNAIGYYRPKAYIKPAPTPPAPTPTPTPVVDKCTSRAVVKGDTLGKIMKECEGKIQWGAKMNAYAQSWISSKTGNTVFYGWTHGTGYGLLAGDTITRSNR